MAIIVRDRFSQRLFIVPTRKKTTDALVAKQFYDEITCRAVRWVPRELISDRDFRLNYNSKIKSTLCEACQRKLGTCTRFASSRTHSSNVAVVREIAGVIEVSIDELDCDLNPPFFCDQ